MKPIQYGYGLPPDLSTHGQGIDQLIYIIHIFMIALFIGWGIFLTYTLIKYRARPGHKANYESSTSKLPKFIEIGIVAFEVFLLIGLSFPVWNAYKSDPPDEKEALTIKVVGQQFAWYFQYPGKDGQLGSTNIKLVNDFNPIGIDAKDPASHDDFFTAGQMHIPVNKPIIAQISSKDVIHAFGVPVLRLKQDATPGLAVPIWFTAKETGQFEIVCSQLCGVGHSLMKGTITVDTAEDFEKWAEAQQKPYQPKEKKQARLENKK